VAILQAEVAVLLASALILNFVLGKNPTPERRHGPVCGRRSKWRNGANALESPVSVTPALASGSFLVGNFNMAAQIFDRMGIEILISTEDGTNFQKTLITIRAENRLVLACKRPAALITGTLPGNKLSLRPSPSPTAATWFSSTPQLCPFGARRIAKWHA
jgi:hypothetical protein